MKLFSRPRSRAAARRIASRRRVGQGTALTLVAGVLVVAAVSYEGSPIHDVQLNDGGVWVTNSGLNMMARLNSQVGELEMGILTSSTSTAVFQEAASVQVYDDGGGNPERSVAVTNVVAGTSSPVPLPATYEVSAGRDTVAILDDATGNAWVERADQVASFNETVVPDLKVAPNSGVVVTKSGTALVADRAKGRVTAWRLDQTGLALKGDTFEFDGEFTDDAVISAVGDIPVVLQAGMLFRAGEDGVKVSGDRPVLQQPGPASDQVYVATERGLWRADLGSGGLARASDLAVDGPPAAPVVVEGCVYSAWNDPETTNYLQLCDEREPVTGEIKRLEGARLMFRTNRDVVVLNDVNSGYVWMVQELGMEPITDWQAVFPNAKDPQTADQVEKRRDSKRNRPPEAQDDEFGARKGKTVVLPVTLNDVDPDGDIITITRPPGAKNGTTFSVVGDGTQIQAKVSPNASGSITFDYEITDGRLGNKPDKAQVTLRVFGDDTDDEPFRIENQKNTLRVADGHEASVNVLPAWIDPEGDSLVLVDASTEDGGEVGFRADGTIDFADSGDGPGRKTITFRVRGGSAEASGKLAVTVQDEEKAAPEAVADHVTGLVNSSILLEPVVNDVDPLGAQLTLPQAEVVDGGAAELVRETARGTATFRALRHGTYYVEYQSASSNGRLSKPTLIRVDVRARTGNNQSPIATRDVAAVRPGSSALVDVLANDLDPDGDVMVVQGVEVSRKWDGFIKASLINKKFVRVEPLKSFDGAQPTFDYLLSDGRDQVRGAVTVSAAEKARNRRPTAVQDVVTARAGTIIDVPVLDNDTDPDGDKLTVFQADLFDPGRQKVIAEKKIPVVATGSSIRVLVPRSGVTQLVIGYVVRDPDRARSGSRLVLNIEPDDPAGNQAPRPRPIEDRTVSGQKIRVPLASFGIDPDGDPVVLSAVAEPPKFGRIVATGTDWFEYEPFEGEGNTGTDEFKLRLSDQYGLTGTADVRIGVAPRSVENQAPAALDDDLLVKPGLTIRYPVMQNDSDPDGDVLLLEDETFQVPRGMQAKLAGTSVEVRAPELEGRPEATQAVQYSVTDGLGSSSSALFTVTSRSDAPDHAPTAQDDVVPAADLRGKRAGDTVDVDVLDNDGDLDGAKDDLSLAVVGTPGSKVAGRKIRVTLKPDSQVVPYRITDRTDQTSFGFIFVFGTDNMPPILDTSQVPVEVKAGEPATIELDDVIVVRPGRSPKIAVRDRIVAAQGSVRAEGTSALVFQAPKIYYGPASVTLDVHDGASVNDPEAKNAQITIPISVLPAGNVPPQVRSAEVVVIAGQSPRSLLLDRLASDVNDDDLRFQVSGARDGVRAELSDDRLELSAARNAPSNEVALTVTVSDGNAKSVTGRIRVVVFGVDEAGGEDALAPPMVLRELTIPDGEKGEPSVVDLRDAIVFDPFKAKQKKVLNVEVVGRPGGNPSVAGTTLTVTPTDDGEVTIKYELDDGSGDASRAVGGLVTVIVAAVPDPPGKPEAVESSPSAIQLTWREPETNGSPIERVRVRDEKGTIVEEEDCRPTFCEVTGLEPGGTYRFSVEAKNRVGWSEGSKLSERVTPDRVPEVMDAPTIEDFFEDRDGKLHLHWDAPDNSGTSIEEYRITAVVNGEGLAPIFADASADTAEFSGLTNGRSYTFTIASRNERGWSGESLQSAEAVPFTRPQVMPAPGLAPSPAGALDDTVTVSWQPLDAPKDGHDGVTSYEIRVTQDGSELTTVLVAPGEAEAHSDGLARVFAVEDGHSYAAQIRAINRAGKPDYSDPSTAKFSYDPASVPTNITKVSDCPNLTCQTSTSTYRGRVGFTTPADNGGYPVTKYRYVTEDGSQGTATVTSEEQGEGVSAEIDIDFTSNAPNQEVTLTPITTIPNSGEVPGVSAVGGDFDPFAKPFAPTGSAGSGYRSVSFTWNAGDGNGRPVVQTESTGAVAKTAVGGSSTSVPTAQGGELRCIQVRSRTEEGGWSAWSAPAGSPSEGICGTSQARVVTVYFTAAAPRYPCNSSCDDINFRLDGFRSDFTYQWTSNITSSVTNQNKSGNVTTGGDGRADLRQAAIYSRAVYDETYCITVDGVTGCAKGN